jgi:hypothetical protein
MSVQNIYHTRINEVLGRALSQIDYEVCSGSRGSFDRTWWSWKFTDFSAPRFQEGVFLLAWLFTSPSAPGTYRANPRILDIANSAIRFWTRLQHSNGSFDEAYPFERSLAATAFTGFYLGCAVERLRSSLSQETIVRAQTAFERLANWLDRNGEDHGILSNHLIAAAAALQVIGDVLNTNRYTQARDRYIGIVQREQNYEEGWFREYGGADPGYQSLGMFYMAEIWRRTQNDSLFRQLESASNFMAWFAHPDGTFGGEYCSRGTKFSFPAAFEILAPYIDSAKGIAAHLRKCISVRRGVGPAEVDAWNFFPLLNNFLFAADIAETLDDPSPLPWQLSGAKRVFPGAGLAVARGGNHVFAAAPGYGGALKLWDATTGELLYEDCGYAIGNLKEWAGSQVQSVWQHTARSFVSLNTLANFGSISNRRFNPPTFMLFRGFLLTAGRIPTIAKWLKRVLVRILIRDRSTYKISLRREVRFAADGALTIVDRVEGEKLDGLLAVDRQVPIHMGSARYCDAQDFLGARFGCPSVSIEENAGARKIVISADAMLSSS